MTSDANTLRIVSGGASHPGKHRPENQDGILMLSPLFAVADGLGGHVGGQLAASLALQTLAAATPAELAEIGALLFCAHEAVKAAATDPDHAGMCTTIVGCVVDTEVRTAEIFNVGDSRAYLWRDGALTQISRDHSLVQHLVDLGELTPEEARTSKQRNVVTQAIGGDNVLRPAVQSIDLQAGDRLLLCSDGVHGEASTETIASLLGQPSYTDIAGQLVQAALDAGGRDNATAVVLCVEETGQ